VWDKRGLQLAAGVAFANGIAVSKKNSASKYRGMERIILSL
jgi:hypothetical protein